MDENVQLAKLFASKMIARPDVKALQVADGGYRPMKGSPFKLPDLLDHIEGRKTYGHYMVSPDDSVKLFCFDIDINKYGRLPKMKNGAGMFFNFDSYTKEKNEAGQPNMRELWGSRKPGAERDFLKLKLKMLGNQLASAINKELEIPTAVAYSGSKGVHVYGFTDKTSATLARQAASIVLDSLRASNMGFWTIDRGNNFYKYVPDGPWENLENPELNCEQFGMEVFPKQDSVEGKEKGLGNLLRLPLGVNQHSPKKDKAFFLDMRTALTDFSPRNAVEALTIENQWQ